MSKVDRPNDDTAGSRPSFSRHRQSLADIVREIDEEDARSRYEEEAADRGVDDKHVRRGSLSDEDDRTIVAWNDGDPENPYNWSSGKKTWILITTMMTIINSTMGSALPSNAIPYIAAEYGITSDQEVVLPISIYLIGYVFGPIIWGPLSEQYGRRLLIISTFCVFSVWTMACALAPNWVGLLVFRLFAGVFASAPIAIVTGVFADIYGDPVTRGRGMALFMVTTVFGPLIAPIISGFCSPTIGWRWSFWIALIYAGATLIPTLFLPETFGPVLLARRAAAIRKADPAAQVIAPHELEGKDLKQLVTIVLTRPLRMIMFEPIVSTTCLYLSLVYSIFYMSFQAFPLIFRGIYGLSPGVTGLAFLPIGLGSLLCIPVFLAYDVFLAKAQARNAPWTKREEYRRLPLACLGGPLFVVSLFWLGFSARSDVHYIVPMMAGVPFGFGFVLIFMALLNYLTDAYEIYAASANAAASTCRSLLATVLPLATTPMFLRLGIPGACSLLGGFSAGMCVIPFIFIWKGERIRAASRFCLALKERKEELARKVEAQRARRAAQEGKNSSPVPESKETV